MVSILAKLVGPANVKSTILIAHMGEMKMSKLQEFDKAEEAFLKSINHLISDEDYADKRMEIEDKLAEIAFICGVEK